MTSMHRVGRGGNRWHRRIASVVLLPIALALGLAACGSTASPGSTAQASAPKTLLPISFLTEFIPLGEWVPLYYAEHNGYFARQGLDVSITYGKGSATTASAIAAGTFDMGTSFSGNAALTAAEGGDIVSFGSLQGTLAFGFLVPKSSGITTVQGLAGKSLLVSAGTAQYSFLPGVMKAAGMSINSVHLEVISPATRDAEYEQGVGDADVSEIPAVIGQVQAQRPSNTILWDQLGFTMPTDVFVGNTTFLKAHPKVAQEFMYAYDQGQVAAYAHEATAEAQYAAAEPTLSHTAISAGFVDYKPYTCSKAMDAAKDPLGYPNLSDWSTGLNLMKEYFGVSASVNLSQVVTTQAFNHSQSLNWPRCPNV